MNSHISYYGLGLRASVSECRFRGGLRSFHQRIPAMNSHISFLRFRGFGFCVLGRGCMVRCRATLAEPL